jgi:hypothetical protein
MTALTQTVPAADADTPAPGPRRTLHVLRVLAVLHSLAALLQPVLAGSYLGGEVDAITIHGVNAHVVTGLGVFQLVAAIVFVWAGRGRAWPLHATLTIVLAEQVQVFAGFEGPVALHIPLGVSIISMQILLTVWLFRAAAATPRPSRRRRS